MPLILQLGSNLGYREIYLARARAKLEQRLGPILQQSSIYETAPWGVEDQDHFLNQVIEIDTTLAPLACLTICQEVEQLLGRQREQKWGPRTIDIDLLLFDEHQSATEELGLPHPQLQDRRFVLIPLCEIASDVQHPGFHQSIRQLLDKCTDSGQVLRYLRNPTAVAKAAEPELTTQGLINTYQFEDSVQLAYKMILYGHLIMAFLLGMAGLYYQALGGRFWVCLTIFATTLLLFRFYNWRNVRLNATILIAYLFSVYLEYMAFGLPELRTENWHPNSFLNGKGNLTELFIAITPLVYLCLRLALAIPLIQTFRRSRQLN
ncbi:MAG: 2-amino-4-hydroxy-6-hydroxymethyldihydropteridine diphosphokinase [Bacteroidota bacterium]